jgi:integrase
MGKAGRIGASEEVPEVHTLEVGKKGRATAKEGRTKVSVYKRGDVWWYKFWFNGQLIRESTKSDSKTVAKDAERARRRELEQAFNRIPKRDRLPLFSHAADMWLANKLGLATKSKERYEQCVAHLKEEFGKGLVCDLDANDIAEYRRKRLAAGLSNRTVNYEIGALRGVLRQFGLWGPIADHVKALPERHDVGQAISAQDEKRILAAASQSRSPVVLPLIVLSIDSGLRKGETKALCRKDLRLEWANGSIVRGELVVSKSKTATGTGRVIPLSRRICACLSLWLERFPEAGPDSFVFPLHRVGFAGNSRSSVLYDVDLSRPMGSWHSAWRLVCKAAGVRYRQHDMRHTFISRLAENPGVSEQTIKALAGHVSRQMLERYSHIRSQAKQAAIRALEQTSIEPVLQVTGHKIGHNDAAADGMGQSNCLKTSGAPGRT